MPYIYGQVISFMTRVIAQYQLKAGYLVAVSSFLIGSLALNNLGSGVFTAYMAWGTYWGLRIVGSRVGSFFTNTNVAIVQPSISKLLWHLIMYKLTILIITLILAYFIGTLGGGIIKQITLMKVK